jgi:NADH-quinone oxidoreductase subunit H
MFISGAVMATLFFGGYNFPFMDNLAVSPNTMAAIGFFVLFAKITFFGFVFMWVRWTLPRFRYDQLMRLGWKGLIPLAILNVVITGIVILVK